MKEITTENVIEELEQTVPEFLEFYNRAKHLGSHDIDIFKHLGRFTMGSLSHAETTDTNSNNKIEDIDDLLHRILRFVERAAISSDPEVASEVKISFVGTVYLVTLYWDRIFSESGPVTKSMMLERATKNKKWIETAREWDESETNQD